jgi:hypothetical protein
MDNDEVKIVAVEITDENRAQLLHMAIAQYTGEPCRYCGHVYETVEDIYERNVVFAGPYMLACKSCFNANNPATLPPAEEGNDDE